MKKYKGFVLISTLTITSIMTLLAFSQISENRLQERIAGNQQKEVNARLAAERGIIDAFEYIKLRNEAGDSNQLISKALSSNEPFPSDASYSLQDVVLNGAIFSFVSKGDYQSAYAYLKTEIEAFEVTGTSVFTDAVAGCDGVYIGQGGGVVNSYDSRVAPYDDNNFNSNGSVSTINSGGDIELSGSGSVYGNLVSNGDISTGTSSGSSISGVMTAAENIQLKGITSTGNIHAGGNLDFSGLDATGQEITVGNDLSGNSGNSDIQSSVVYGGENNTALESAVWSADIIPPDTEMGECDPLDIINEMTEIEAQVTSSASTINNFVATMTGNQLEFAESTLSSDGTIVNGVSPTTLEVFGEEREVYIFDELNMDQQNLVITGDITLLIIGDISTKKSNFVFPEGDDTSSLTIITDGKINLDSLTDLFTDATVNADGEAPLTIYSAYESTNESDPAINVGSNADMYARLYAPSGNVDLGGGGDIMGAVRAKDVSISAGTGIHYDEALEDMIDIEDDNPTGASYSSFYYYYPN